MLIILNKILANQMILKSYNFFLYKKLSNFLYQFVSISASSDS